MMMKTPPKAKRWTEERIAERLFYLIERIDELEHRITELEGGNGEENGGEPETVSKILHIHHHTSQKK